MSTPTRDAPGVPAPGPVTLDASQRRQTPADPARQRQRDALAAMMLAYLAKCEAGLTGSELAHYMGKRIEVIRPRLTEMSQARWIFDTGQRRRRGLRGPAERVWSWAGPSHPELDLHPRPD